MGHRNSVKNVAEFYFFDFENEIITSCYRAFSSISGVFKAENELHSGCTATPEGTLHMVSVHYSNKYDMFGQGKTFCS